MSTPGIPTADEISAEQRAKGIRKYGGCLRANAVPLSATIRHAREEAADLVDYLSHAAEMELRQRERVAELELWLDSVTADRDRLRLLVRPHVTEQEWTQLLKEDPA